VVAFGREIRRVLSGGVTPTATAVETIVCKLDLDEVIAAGRTPVTVNAAIHARAHAG